MKTIKRKKIEDVIKKEYALAHKFCSHDFGRCYKIMIDTDDGDIWSDVFLSENEWKVYHDDSVLSLSGNGRTVKEIESAYIMDAIGLLTETGWVII